SILPETVQVLCVDDRDRMGIRDREPRMPDHHQPEISLPGCKQVWRRGMAGAPRHIKPLQFQDLAGLELCLHSLPVIIGHFRTLLSAISDLFPSSSPAIWDFDTIQRLVQYPGSGRTHM